MKFLKIMVLGIISVVGLFVLLSMFIGYMLSAPVYRGEKSDHFNGSTFENPGNVTQHGLGDLLKWALNRDQGPWTDIETADRVTVPQNPDPARIYYVNHSTFLIQVGEFNILTDPVWSERVSPFSFAGPRRKRPPGIRIEDLPEIHMVLISHNHYDHLDVSTLKHIDEKFSPQIIAPLGVPAYLAEKGLGPLVEMDWWQEKKINDHISIACVPAQHFSGRGMFDRNKTLWAGYVIKADFGNIYFAGDTGYGDFFGKIAETYAPINLALLPIGAYKPRWFMSPVHISPEEAVAIHKDMNAQKSIAMHFGTFPLGDDGMWEPVEDLQKSKQKLKAENFSVLQPGEFISLH